MNKISRKLINIFIKAEYNVQLVYLFHLFYCSATSILFDQILSGYIFIITKTNKSVGIIKGIQGIMQLLFAFPAGYLTDYYRRDCILKLAGSIGMISFLFTFSSFFFFTYNIKILYISFGLWGIFSAFQSPSMEAIFTDSIPHGKRAYPFTIKFMIMNIARILGPLTSILLFLFCGDHWSIPELQTVLLFGTILVLFSLFILFKFNDDLTYEKRLEAEKSNIMMTMTNSKPETISHLNKTDDPNENIDSLLLVSPATTTTNEFENENFHFISTPRKSISTTIQKYTISNDISLQNDNDIHTGLLSNEKLNETENSFFLIKKKHVPFLLFTSDFIISNGAGMTINFFPLFFMQEYYLSPIHINLLFLFQPILILLFSYIAEKIASDKYDIGRMKVIVFTRIFSTFCLISMSQIKNNLYLQIMFFLLRGSMMRCSEALRRSVLMDHVPINQRGKWNSLEGLTAFTWSGSAVLGGYLIDIVGYYKCFLYTSIIYFCGLSIECLLIPVTKEKQKNVQMRESIN